MRSRISVIALVALLLMLGAIVMIASAPASALSITPDGEFVYQVNGGTVEIVQYIGQSPNVLIPSTIESLPVSFIGPSAFAGTVPLSSVQIPEGVTSIGDLAFYHCQATIDLPDTLVNIGNSAFAGCTGLTAVSISSSVVSIGNNAFLGCTNINSLSFDNSGNLQTIGGNAFASCSSLQSITIPESVTSIGNGAFQSCSVMTWISVYDGNQYYTSVNGVLYNKAITTLIQYPLAKTGSFTIPSGVTSIQSYAFSSSTGLTGVIIPIGVNAIGDSAFSSCPSLTRMEFKGDQPATLGSNWITNHAGLSVYYHYGAAGFTTPTWQGVNSVPVFDLAMSSNFGTTTAGGSYDQGTTVTITATAPTANPGEQYVWNGWIGTGAGSITGGNPAVTITMNAEITEEASWTEQYQVSFAVTPAGAGTTMVNNWYAAGTLPIQATASPGYAFSSWTSDNSAITFGTQSQSAVANIGGPGTITATFTLMPVSVTIASDPAGSGYVLVDGTATSTPATFSWVPGTSHTLEALSTVAVHSGEQYLFSTWSDGGLRAHTYTATMSAATITAEFNHQYQITMATNGGTTVPGAGSGWYFAGTKISLDAVGPASGPGYQYVWNGWTGTGAGSYSGGQQFASGAVTVNGIITETANWTKQYQVTFVATPSGTGTTSPAPGTGWYNAGSLPIQASPTSGYAFSSWASDSGAITFGSQSASATAVITGAGKITASFTILPVSVTITSNPAGTGYVMVDGIATATPVTFTNWLPGDTHTLGAVGTIAIGSTEKYTFNSWSDGGQLTHTYTVTMSAATITANFDHQYLVTMATNAGTTSPAVGAQWYEAGSQITLDASPPLPGNGVQYGVQFYWNGWTGTGAGSYTGSKTLSTNAVTVNAPITETGSWTKQYLITFAVSPNADPVAGTIIPTLGWYNADGGLPIQASPSAGYDFSSWTSNSTSVTFSAQTSTAVAHLAGPGTVTANFVARPVQVTIASTQAGPGYVLVDGNAITTPATFSWFPGESHDLKAVSNLTVGNGERWNFTSWSDSGLQDHTYTVTISPITITANFAHQFLFTAATTGGSTMPGVGAHWLNASSQVTLDASAPPAGTGYRFVWNGWTGTGVGSYTGDVQTVPNAVTVLGPITETANWTEQFQISYAVTPAGGGTTSPAGINQWVKAGPIAVQATNLSNYAFSSWTSGSDAITFSSQAASTTVNVNGPGTITANFVLARGITITSDPTGSGYIMVDNVAYASPQNFKWAIGANHSIAAVSSVAGVAGERFVFDSWSDAGAQSHTYTVTALTATVIAKFDHQFLLSMATNLGTTVPGAGSADTWKNAGSTVVLNAIAPAASAVNQRYLWAGWTGTGPGNYTGTGAIPGVSIVMFGPITETAAWDLQYQVTMATNYGTTLPIAGNSWFDAGSNITLSATAPVAGPDERNVFNGWNGTGIGAYSGMDNPASNAAAVGGPITETASWNLQRLPGAPVNLSAQIGDGMVSLTWEAPNGGGLPIDHYVVYQDGVEVKTVLTLYATITGLANGQAYSFTVAAHNAIGNGSSPTAVVVTPMLGASSLSLEIISPLSGAFTRNGSALLVWNASDSSSTIVRTEVSSEVSQWITVTGTSYRMSGLKEGPHTLFVRVTDAKNNVVTRSVPMVVDSTAPMVTILLPLSQYLNSHTVTFNWMIIDNLSGLASTEISSDGKNWTFQFGTSYTLTGVDGSYKFYIRATDNAGNVVTSINPYTIDTVPPLIMTKSPTGNAESTLVTINLTFNEAMNRASTIVSVVGVTGTAVWAGNSVSFTPSTALKGRTTFNVSVNGMDLAGNPISKTWTFRTAVLGKISGVVYGYNGNVLANAVVKLIGISTAAQTGTNSVSLAASGTVGRVVQTTTTDAWGVYAFYDVAIGNYTLEVTEAGHQTRSTPVSMTSAAIDNGGLTIDPGASPAGLADGVLFIMALVAISAAIAMLVLVVRKRRSSPPPTGPNKAERPEEMEEVTPIPLENTDVTPGPDERTDEAPSPEEVKDATPPEEKKEETPVRPESSGKWK